MVKLTRTQINALARQLEDEITSARKKIADKIVQENKNVYTLLISENEVLTDMINQNSNTYARMAIEHYLKQKYPDRFKETKSYRWYSNGYLIDQLKNDIVLYAMTLLSVDQITFEINKKYLDENSK